MSKLITLKIHVPEQMKNALAALARRMDCQDIEECVQDVLMSEIALTAAVQLVEKEPMDPEDAADSTLWSSLREDERKE